MRGSANPDDLLRNLDQWYRFHFSDLTHSFQRSGETVLAWAVAQGHHGLLEAMLEGIPPLFEPKQNS